MARWRRVRHADAFIEDIKMMFGDADSDATEGYNTVPVL
jgi:hypothetical protein